jgi:hypothetical protein
MSIQTFFYLHWWFGWGFAPNHTGDQRQLLIWLLGIFERMVGPKPGVLSTEAGMVSILNEETL